MLDNRQVIVTLGPSTFNHDTLKKIEARDVDYVRINLSHTSIDDLKDQIIKVRTTINTPLIIDTEGSQVRTGPMKTASTELEAGSVLQLHSDFFDGDSKKITLRPKAAIQNLSVGDLLFIDHDAVIVRVDCIDQVDKLGYLQCFVINGGCIGANKAVAFQSQNFSLPALSQKDRDALQISKELGIETYTLSFVDNRDDVLEARALHPQASLIAKIETRAGVINIDEILEVADGILIDRGDLSREIPAQKIPFIQKFLIHKAQGAGVPVYVATNFLDTMMKSLRPSRAEVNDIINTLLDGATGLVLAAETAIGDYPLETINLLKNLTKEVASNLRVKDSNKLDHEIVFMNFGNAKEMAEAAPESLLIHPHGGPIKEQIYDGNLSTSEVENLFKIPLTDEDVMDVEQLAVGSYNPLRGFLNEDDFQAVLTNCRLASGLPWSIPVLLHISQTAFSNVRIDDTLLLVHEMTGKQVALLTVEDRFKVDLEDSARRLYGTIDRAHPGVQMLLDRSPYAIGGKVTLLERSNHPLKSYELTPLQARTIFESRGWARVVGFHSRNPIHRAHEFIQRTALERSHCDGLFLHPVTGKKKEGDFSSEAIVKSYDTMMKTYYKHENAVFGTFATYSRYAGPREALFTAICRQNYGCSHFIVGRDHTGVGSFYGPRDSQEIFSQFEDIDIEPVFFKKISYCEPCNSYVEGARCPHGADKSHHISGTEVRQIFSRGETPPDWFMRKNVADAILNTVNPPSSLFVQQGANSEPSARILWLSGLSGSGKSTIASELSARLKEDGHRVKILDGDDVRNSITSHLGFSFDDIIENNLTIAEIARNESTNYDYILVPVISPFKEGRSKAKSVLKDSMTQIYIATSLDECRKRDPKGLYAKAEKGEVDNFIGIDLPFEPPEDADIVLQTEGKTVDASVEELVELLS